ncbi:DUF934 domain-containing protein [Pseudohongiella nitratireducens]|uniref:DUF934 domain-containing protein n=1 Tax=Pseudohongiella nitratireducens TaxID=1768907 RepID=UPI0030EB8878|tara:strand:+ start:508 stop:1038 length:531 start_codon:yes stop_codon:yes gene_type:complete
MSTYQLPKQLIANCELADNDWLWLGEDAEAADLQAIDGAQHVIAPVALWLSAQDQVAARQGHCIPWLGSANLAAQLAESVADINTIPMIALFFPVFSDGRNYSNARELRTTLGFDGDILAAGDVLRDQVFYMHRCGINVFAMREDQDLDDALKAFADFQDGYQVSVDKPVPLFRRR